MSGYVLYEGTRRGYLRDSLAGLSVGDALGAQYFMVGRRVEDLRAGTVPPAPWEWTDDTEMACSIVQMLHEDGRVDADRLALAFADRCEPNRGYGAGAFVILHSIRRGIAWREAAGAVFDGQGSCGNGAAMRVAPLGAYHAGAPAEAAREAAVSARVTHSHAEGVAGAIAVAVAASLAVAGRLSGDRPSKAALIDAVLRHVPEGTVHRGLRRARRLGSVSVEEAAYELGNGSQVTAQDTVPFTLWVAGQHLADYPAAILACVTAGGDADTTSAIVGGIVAAHTGVDGIPPDWLTAREPLPDWLTAGDTESRPA